MLMRTVAINLAGIYLSTVILSGIVTFSGGLKTLFLASLAIIIINLVVKPVINLLLLPLHLVTLGFSRWIANLGVLYLITLFVPNLTIHPFTSSQISLPFIIIPSFGFSVFGAFLFSAFITASVFNLLYWLFQD